MSLCLYITVLAAAYDEALSKLKPGVKLSEVYLSAKEKVKSLNSSLVDKFTNDAGAVNVPCSFLLFPYIYIYILYVFIYVLLFVPT